MKDVLKRMLGKATAPAQAEAAQDEVVELAAVEVTEVVDPAVAEAVVDAATADMQAALATATADVANLTAELTAARDKIAELTAEVTAAVEFHAAREKAALEAKLAARKEKIVAAVGTEKADALMAATVSMEDGAFNAVMAAMATTQTAEATTALFSEVGVEAEVDKSKLAAESNPVMDYLTSKYK